MHQALGLRLLAVTIAGVCTQACATPHKTPLEATYASSSPATYSHLGIRQEQEAAESRYQSWRVELHGGTGFSGDIQNSSGLGVAKRITPEFELGLYYQRAEYERESPFGPYYGFSGDNDQHVALATVRFYLHELANWEPWIQIGAGNSWAKDYWDTPVNKFAAMGTIGASYPITPALTLEPSISQLDAIVEGTFFQIALAINF